MASSFSKMSPAGASALLRIRRTPKSERPTDTYRVYPASGDDSVLKVFGSSGKVEVELRVPTEWLDDEVAERLLRWVRVKSGTPHLQRVG